MAFHEKVSITQHDKVQTERTQFHPKHSIKSVHVKTVNCKIFLEQNEKVFV